MLIKFTLYFSYWILLWFILFLLFNKNIIAPFYSFIIASIYHIIIILYTYYLIGKINIMLIIHFIVYLFFKIIPIFIIYNYYPDFISLKKEIIIFIILFILFLIWKYICNNNNMKKEFNNFIKNGNNYNTPIVSIVTRYYVHL